MQTQPKMEKEIDIISFEKAPVEAKKCSPNRTFCLPFPPEEYAERFNRVRKAMQKAKVDVAISTAHRDFHWLTGNKVDFWAAESPQWIIISDQEAIGVVRHLEASTHRMCSYLKDWVEYPDAGPINPYDPVGYTVATLKKLGLHKGRIGMNFRVVSLEEFHRFDQLLPEAELVDFRVEKVRSRRSPLELDCLRKAATVNQKAIMDTVQKLQVGWSEWRILKELNRRHEYYLKNHDFYSTMSAGACQVGENVKQMHAIRSPIDRRAIRAKPGDLIWLEPGVYIKDYVGCMIRMVFLGNPPKEITDAFNTTLEAYHRLIDEIEPGKTSHEVDAACREYLTSRGYEMQHRSGYMINEKWMDGGILSFTPDNPNVIEEGHVYHLPIHVYLPRWGYMGLSEQILITQDGCEVLGDYERICPQELFVKEVEETFFP